MRRCSRQLLPRCRYLAVFLALVVLWGRPGYLYERRQHGIVVRCSMGDSAATGRSSCTTSSRSRKKTPSKYSQSHGNSRKPALGKTKSASSRKVVPKSRPIGQEKQSEVLMKCEQKSKMENHPTDSQPPRYKPAQQYQVETWAYAPKVFLFC